MPRYLPILIAFLAISHAQTQAQIQPHNQFPAMNVGDIPFDPALDDTSFHIADSNHIFQYYQARSWWLENKKEYESAFLNTSLPRSPDQSGWLTIRFIVNAAGRTGRFRLFQMDSAYQPCRFNPAITQSLLNTTKTIPWEPAKYKGKKWDTYQYITFHLERGRIIDIMP